MKEDSYLSRKKFLKLSSLGLFFYPLYLETLSGSHRFRSGPDSIPMNSKERKEYTVKLLNRICSYGPRPVGSSGYLQGAKIIKEELEKIEALKVSEDPFIFDEWKVIEPPRLKIGDTEIETCFFTGSPGINKTRKSAGIRKDNDRFVVFDSQNNEIISNIGINSYGRAIPGYYSNSAESQPSTPYIGVGRQDVPVLEKGINNRLPVNISGSTSMLPNKGKGMNIVCQLPGKTEKEILFLAHADTVYMGPGANDNTASVIVMMLLAFQASLRGNHEHTLTFVATDGEEYGYVGAKNYARTRIADNSIRNIKFIVNFDSVTWGPNLWINSFNEEIKEEIRRIHKYLRLPSIPRFESSDGFSMDSSPFRLSESRAMHVNSRGYDERTLPVYHRPDDKPETVPLDCVEQAFLVFNEFIKRVDKL